MSGQGLQVNVDLVLCIDATGSMTPIIDEVKEGAMNFHEKLMSALDEANRQVDQFRVKVIVFRDYWADPGEAMLESAFFNLPQETGDFKEFVSKISAKGGGDEPESALESIAIAMKSDWIKEGVKKRHIIMVWTDASSHPLERAVNERPAGYPDDMPRSFVELSDWWNDPQGGMMNNSAKRLILFAPDAYPWSDIATTWNNVVHVPSKAGSGMSEVDMDIVMKTLAGSI